MFLENIVTTDIDELEAMGLGALRKRAIASGCDEDEVEEALDEDDADVAKEALIDMIVLVEEGEDEEEEEEEDEEDEEDKEGDDDDELEARQDLR